MAGGGLSGAWGGPKKAFLRLKNRGRGLDNFCNSGKRANAARQNSRGQRCNIAPRSRTLAAPAMPPPMQGRGLANAHRRFLCVRAPSCVALALRSKQAGPLFGERRALTVPALGSRTVLRWQLPESWDWLESYRGKYRGLSAANHMN